MIQTVINKLLEILPTIRSMSKDRRELKDTALKTISTALNETYLYYRDLDKGKDRSLEKEELLSKYWAVAAIPMRHFDQELSMICDHKAEYWINPERYCQEEIQALGIGLSEVRQACREILNPFFYQKRK